MSQYLLKRFLSVLPVIFGAATLVFFLIHFIPGDPVEIMLGDAAEAIDKEQLREKLGLHRPLLDQYGYFWKNIFDGSGGQSIAFGRDVFSLVWERFGATLILSFSGLFVAILISLPLGIVAAKNAGKWQDSVSVGFALLGMSVPIFVLAPLAILFFSIELRWLPVAGFYGWEHLVLPSLCLGFGLSGILTRMLRTSLIECLGEDYIQTARAKGLRYRDVITKHALKNALIPVVTILGNMLGGLLAGAVITETLFDWPGVGKLFYSAFQSRDYPLVQGIVLWISTLYVLINFFVDILYSYIDPRVRYDS